MAPPGETLGVEPRAASQIENAPGSAAEYGVVNPCDLLIDDLETTAGSIVVLGEMLLQHSPAEVGIVPWKPTPRGERDHGRTMHERSDVHESKATGFLTRRPREGGMEKPRHAGLDVDTEGLRDLRAGEGSHREAHGPSMRPAPIEAGPLECPLGTRAFRL